MATTKGTKIVFFKQMGQNLNVTFEGEEVMSKRVVEKEERDAMVALIKEVKEKPNLVKEKKIRAFFTKNTTAEKAKEDMKKATVKAVEKKVVKESKKVKKEVKTPKIEVKAEDKDRLEQLEKENAKLKEELKAAPAPVASPYKRRGEY